MKMPDCRVSRVTTAAALAVGAAALLYFSFTAPRSVNAAEAAQASVSTGAGLAAHDRRQGAETTSSLPPVAAHLRPDTALLQLRRSAAKDFQDANQCVMAMRKIALAEHQLGMCNSVGAEGDADLKAFCERREALILASAAADNARLSSCSSLDPGAAEQKNFEYTSRAAALGDVDAQLCYVNADFKLPRPWTAQEHTDYADRAPQYVEAALSRGDWRVVEILRVASRGVAEERGLVYQLTTGDQLAIYRMNRLLRMGAVDDYARYLDNLLERPVFPHDEEEIAQADRWVRTVFNDHFRTSPSLRTAPNTCLQNRP